MQHLTQNELVLFCYREMSGVDRRRAEEHLQRCDLCRRELASLREFLGVIESLPVPERDETYGGEVWSRILPRLPDKFARRWNLVFPWRAWALAGSAAALMVVAFWSGRFWQQRQTPAMASIPPTARQQILMVAVGDHLDRAQVLLVGLMHEQADGPADVSRTKQLAQDLLQSNRLYRQAALRDGDPGMADVLDDLERILLHISHSPSEISAAELASLQHQIEFQGILFKVRVVELDAQVKPKSMGPPRSGTAL